MDFLIIFAAKYLFLLIIFAFLLNFFLISKEKRKGFVVFAFFTAILVILGDKIFGFFYNNPRPYVVEHIKPLIEHTADNGFPSGHTLISMTASAITFVYNRKLGIILGVLAIIVGGARVLAKVHHPVDILGSVVLAIGATYICLVLLKKVLPKVKF